MDIDIRPVGQADPEAINRVVESVVMTQHLPDRVNRLSLPVYRYVGSQLFRVVEEAVCEHGFNGLLAKAQQGLKGLDSFVHPVAS